MNGPSPKFSLSASPGLGPWLAETGQSLVFTTYQAGKVFLLGTRADGAITVFERTFPRCMGVAVDGAALWLASHFQLWRFQDALRPGEAYGEHDRVYVPQVAYTTGNLDTHDVAVDKEGRPAFVATAFNCLATTSETHSFRPLWRPPWISQLVAEDRCHLNGLAMKHGRPAYVSVVSRSDVGGGWRDDRREGGLVVAVDSDEIVCEGLSMPHSPRVDGDELWLLEAGSGYLGRVDAARGRFERVCFCPGFARGLALTASHAVVGTSAARQNRTFADLEFGSTLAEKKAEAECGLLVVNRRTGAVDHWLRIEGIVRELYDVAVIPDCRRPMAIGMQTDEIQRVISIDAD